METLFCSNCGTASETPQAQRGKGSRLGRHPLPPWIHYAARAEGRKLQPSHFMTFVVWLEDLKQPAQRAGAAGRFGKPSLHVAFTSVAASVEVMKAGPSWQLPLQI